MMLSKENNIMKTPSKRVMILGASENQVPLIRKCLKRGYFIIVISIKGDYPGFDLANESYFIDIRDKDKILECAKRLKIDAILTDQTDVAVPTVAYVAEKLDLPSIGYQTALRFTDKNLMRKVCRNYGIPSPESQQFRTKHELQNLFKLKFPVIIKPADSQGSRGICKVYNMEQLEKSFEKASSYSSKNEVIIEEFFEGSEVVIEAIVAQGEVLNLVIGDRKYFHFEDKFIPCQTLFPSKLPEDIVEKLLKLNVELIRTFGLKFGQTHSEYLVNEQTGDVCLVETASRGGGVLISSDLIPLSSGVDANELLIDLALDKTINLKEITVSNAASAYVCFSLPIGTIVKIIGIKKILALPFVKFFDQTGLALGKETVKMDDKTARLGPIIVVGQTRLDLEKNIRKVQSLLIIKVQTSQEILGIVWH